MNPPTHIRQKNPSGDSCFFPRPKPTIALTWQNIPVPKRNKKLPTFGESSPRNIYIYIYTHTQSHRVYIFIHYNCFRHIYRGYPEAWHLLYQIDLETTSKIRKALENSHFQLTQRGPKVSSPWRIHFNFGTCGHLWLNEGLHHFPFEKKQLAWEAGKV